MEELGTKLRKLDGNNQLEISLLNYSSAKEKVTIQSLMDVTHGSDFWSPKQSDSQPWLEFSFDKKITLNTVIIGEAIQQGQHIEKIKISGFINGEWKDIMDVGSIGYKKIIEFDDLTLTNIKFDFCQFRKLLNLHYIKLIKL